MKDFKQITFEELPKELKKLISKEKTSAYYKSDKSYVITEYNNDLKYYTEYEYDITKKKFLSLNERENNIPKNEYYESKEYNLKAKIEYFLDKNTNKLNGKYKIYDYSSRIIFEEGIFKCFNTGMVYTAEIIDDYYQEKEKQKRYEALPYQEKINYWVQEIYRAMRWMGEDGDEEIYFFNKEEINRIKKIEPNIEDMMPTILCYLSRLWLIDKEIFFNKVNELLNTTYNYKDVKC